MSYPRSINFEVASAPTFYPQSDVYDWRATYLSRVAADAAAKGEETPEEPPAIVAHLDDHAQPITEENTWIYINRAQPDMDAVAITDERDNGEVYLFRRFTKGFEGIFQLIVRQATIVESNCPLRLVEAIYLEHQAILEQQQAAIASVQLKALLDDPEAVQQWLAAD